MAGTTGGETSIRTVVTKQQHPISRQKSPSLCIGGLFI